MLLPVGGYRLLKGSYKEEYTIRLLVRMSLQDQQVIKTTLYLTKLSVCHNILVSYARCTLQFFMRSQN